MTYGKKGHGSRKLAGLSSHCSDCCIPSIAARRVAGKVYSERYTLIPAAKVLYAFTGSAALDLITARWTNAQDLQSEHVYIRTSTGIFFVHYRSLAVLLRERLESAQFLPLHQSLAVNPRKITDLDIKGRRKKVGVTIEEDRRGTSPNAPHTEWLAVSRRQIPVLRQLLGLPQRGT